jgi:protein O-GlcNAc transferase
MLKHVILLGLLAGVLAFSCAGNRPPSAGQMERINLQRERAALLIERENYRQALDILEDVVRQIPNDPETLGLLAWAQWHTGDSAKAIKNFEASIRDDYSNYLTHLRFGQALLAMGKTGRALTELKLAVQLAGNEPVAFYNYGLVLYRLGRKDEALVQWQRAYELDGDDPVYTEAMGMGLSGRDDRRALGYFEKAESCGRSGASFSHNYALVLEHLGQNNRAEERFLEAVEKAPDQLSYRFDLAAFYMHTGAYDRAVPQWLVLMDKQPEKRAPRIFLARAYLELGRFAEAVAELDSLPPVTEVSSPPGQDEVYAILAMSYRGEGQLEKANLFIEKALKIKPDSVDYLINYGVILADRGMMDLARVQWQRALEIDPDNPIARRNLSAQGQ